MFFTTSRMKRSICCVHGTCFGAFLKAYLKLSKDLLKVKNSPLAQCFFCVSLACGSLLCRRLISPRKGGMIMAEFVYLAVAFVALTRETILLIQTIIDWIKRNRCSN
jgi:hypothetical protein